MLYHRDRTDVEILRWIVGISPALALLEFAHVERSSLDRHEGSSEED